jgi:hypothetical protein
MHASVFLPMRIILTTVTDFALINAFLKELIPLARVVSGTIPELLPMKTNRFALWAAALVAAVLPFTSNAGIFVFDATLSGPAESPTNASPGTGFAQVTFDNTANTMEVNVTFSGLTGTTTASHIHAPTAVAGTGTASVATTTPTFTGFPLGVTSGTYDHIFDMTQVTSYNNPSFITANGGTAASAETALLGYMLSGQSYLNIHSTTFGGGEIRGFLTQVPEPSTAALFGLGLAGSAVLRWRRKCRH